MVKSVDVAIRNVFVRIDLSISDRCHAAWRLSKLVIQSSPGEMGDLYQPMATPVTEGVREAYQTDDLCRTIIRYLSRPTRALAPGVLVQLKLHPLRRGLENAA